MSIRIRKSGGMTIALCAAETDPESGDIYLDDAAHGALSAKFEQDFASMGFMTISGARREWVEMEKHKQRDAETELRSWSAAQVGTHPKGRDAKQARCESMSDAVPPTGGMRPDPGKS